MGNPEEEKQPDINLPAQPVNSTRAKYIEAVKAAREKRNRRRNLFAKTPMGKWWNLKKVELQKTPEGRRTLFAVKLLKSGFYLVLGIAILFGSTIVMDTVFYPADYNLTAQQEQEGYGRTWAKGYRSGHGEDVYVRFYNDSEYGSDHDCSADWDWCVYAIARNKGCHEIYMEFSTREDAAESSPIIEILTASKFAPNGDEFQLGERVTLGVKRKEPKSEYGRVEHIYCRG